MELELDRLCAAANFDYAIRIQNNKSKIVYQVNENQRFLSASLIKILIARYSLEFEKKDPTFINQTLLIDPDHIVGGAGIIRGLERKKWKIRDLIYLMLNVSDNTATNTLINYFGLGTLDKWVSSHYSSLQLKRMMMTKSHEDNIINLSEFMKPWTELFEYNTELGQVILDALRHSLNKNKLAGLLSESSFTGHTYNKTGELTNEEHDVTRFKMNDQIIDCAVLTHFAVEKQRVDCVKFIQRIGLVVANSCVK